MHRTTKLSRFPLSWLLALRGGPKAARAAQRSRAVQNVADIEPVKPRDPSAPEFPVQMTYKG